MRDHMRELSQNDPIGSGIVDTFVNNIIGYGVMAQARTGTEAKDTALESYWIGRKNRLFQADDLTQGEGQRMLLRGLIESGEIFVKAVYGLSEPVWFEIIEADRVDTPAVKAADGNIRSGIERDADGRIVAYWINGHHPGDIRAVKSKSVDNFTRVEAGFVRHLVIRERPGQSRGVPLGHATIQDLRDLDLLLVASLKRTQIAACLSAFIESADNPENIFQLTADKYGYEMDETIQPGMIYHTYPGEKLQSFIPNFPTPELVPFVILLCRRIGAAFGVSWQVVLKDFGDSTYSSARTDLLETRMTYKVLQRLFAERWLDWQWRAVMKDGLLRGELAGVTDGDTYAVQWIPPGWEWVDPEKEALAETIKLENHLTTLQEVCASRGKDWEEILLQRLKEEKREMELRASLGLPEKNPEPDEETATQRMIRIATSKQGEEEEISNTNGNGRKHHARN